MLNVRKMFAINVLQWPRVQKCCKSNLGNKAGEGVYIYDICMGLPKSRG